MVSIEVLRQLSCFEGLNGEQLATVARAADIRSLHKDAFLFRAGDPAHALYILVSGQLVVSVTDSKGRRLMLATIEPGASLGEMGLSQGKPRSADVSAAADSVLLHFDRPQFETLVREQPAFALTLLADLSRKLHESNRKLENRVSLSVKERLWVALAALSSADGYIKPPPKVTHLASRIGATREMTSKALSQLVRDGKILKESPGAWKMTPV